LVIPSSAAVILARLTVVTLIVVLLVMPFPGMDWSGAILHLMADSSAHASDQDLDRAKAALRLRARAARRTVLPEYRAAHAHAVAERVLALPEMASAAAVMLYGPSPEEVDVSVLEFALRQRGVRIAYPRMAGFRTLSVHWVDDPAVLLRGEFGLLEPPEDAPQTAISHISAIIVPGVAFDSEGNRLGFGGGYYDSLLGGPDPVPPTIGVAYDEQIVDAVPHNERDRPTDIVVTPTRVFRRSPASS
jgi:5-formyltetrahydrofolate cyclo-ligase